MSEKEKSDLETAEEFYRLLTEHELPEGYVMQDLPPKMTGEQAFSLIWFLQEALCVLPDHIGRCGGCGELYDTHHEHGDFVESKGEILCESCYEAESAYQCSCCDNHDCHEAPGRLLVITERCGDLEPGLYRIERWPFYADGMITGLVYEDALTRIGDVPQNADTGRYSMGFLCTKCEVPLAAPVS